MQTIQPQAELAACAGLVLFRQGLREVLYEANRKAQFNPGSGDGEILAAFAKQLHGETFATSLKSDLALIEAGRSFSQGHALFRSCLQKILLHSSILNFGRVTKEEAALQLLIRESTDVGLIKAASIFLLEREHPVNLAVAEYQQKIGAASVPAAEPFAELSVPAIQRQRAAAS
jgi:hypothetical protein